MLTNYLIIRLNAERDIESRKSSTNIQLAHPRQHQSPLRAHNTTRVYGAYVMRQHSAPARPAPAPRTPSPPYFDHATTDDTSASAGGRRELQMNNRGKRWRDRTSAAGSREGSCAQIRRRLAARQRCEEPNISACAAPAGTKPQAGGRRP